jgi:regulator of replication initiation timing
MDPLSIIASIAGIATAGAQLSNTLFRVYKTVRHAPREIQAVAIEMSDLSITLEHLHEILETGKLHAKPSLFDAVRHVVKNIEATQQEIFKMVTDNTIIVRLKWLKAAKYLSEIDKQKVTLTLQITILSAAILVKSETKYAWQS